MEADLPDNAVFVSHEEVKQTVTGRAVLKFFVLDKAGNRHLAAIAEDLGDAHYVYRSTKPFSKYGYFESHNRTQLLQWLEMVISESGGHKEGPHLGADEQHPEGIYFTSHRYERAHFPDGRRCNRWYLMDQHGESHLAVIGIERDTKDGHYNYSAEEPFASIAPLQCSNQGGVYKWMEKWITHHTGDASGHGLSGQSAGSISAASEGAAGRKPPLVISLSSILSAKKSAAALTSLEQAVVVEGSFRAKPKVKAESAKVAAAAPPPTTTQKHKAVGIVQQMQIKKARKLQEDIRAEEEKLQLTHLARLRRAAAAEVAGDTAAKATTLGWLHNSLRGEESDHIDHWLSLLKAVLDVQQRQSEQQADSLQTPEQQRDAAVDAGDQQQGAATATDRKAAPVVEGDVLAWVKQPANYRHHLRVALECLKELGAADLPVRELLNRKVIALVQRCLSWPHKAVVSMAQHMVDRWRWQLKGHMHVLSCPTYMEDHLGLLEDEIAYGMVPLPQLPKHKQMLLNTPIPKVLPDNHKTPALAKQSSYLGSYQQQPAPASAPPVLNPAAAGQYMGQAGFMVDQGFNNSGFALAPMDALTPAAGAAAAQGFCTPQSYAAATSGIMPGSFMNAASIQGMNSIGRLPAAVLHNSASSERPTAVPAANASAGMYPQQGLTYVDQTAVTYGGGWSGAAGSIATDSAATAGGLIAGHGLGSNADMAVMGYTSTGNAAAQQQQQQQQQLALQYAMQQQQQQLQMGMMNVQYCQPMQQQQQLGQAVHVTGALVSRSAQAVDLQQWQLQQLQLQQQQQALYWQQQQHMQVVWGQNGGVVQQPQGSAGHAQHSGSQGYVQQ